MTPARILPKILFVGHSAHLAGAEFSLLRLMRSLAGHCDMRVLAPAGARFEAEVRELGLPFQPLRMNYVFKSVSNGESLLPGCLGGMLQQVDELVHKLEKPDLVHSNTYFILEGAFLAARWGVPHIWNLREIVMDSPTWQPLLPYPMLHDLICDMSDHVITVSEALKEKLPFKLQEKSTAVVNGYDGGSALPRAEARALLCERHGIDPAAKILLTVGNFITEKGHAFLLPLLPGILQAQSNAVFFWPGTHHATYGGIRTAVERMGLAGKVIMPGHVEDAGRLMAGADLYLLPSTTEACPTVVLEARLAGLPVLTRRNGGVVEILRHGGGLVLDDDKFGDAVCRVLSGQLAVPAVSANPFTMEHMRDSYFGIYQDAIKGFAMPAARRERVECIERLAAELRQADEARLELRQLRQSRVGGRLYRIWKKLTQEGSSRKA